MPRRHLCARSFSPFALLARWMGAGTGHSARRLPTASLDVEPLEGRWLPSVVMVNTVADQIDGPGSGVVSLRDALATVADGDTITFDSTLAGQAIVLRHGELEVNRSVTITGPGAGLLAINAHSSSRVFQFDSGLNAAVSDLTLTGGSSSGDGGDVYNAGTLTLSGCALTGGNAFGKGGNVYNAGTLILTSCTIADGTATDGSGFAGYGGGLANDGAVTLDFCAVSGNRAGTAGGGLYNSASAPLAALSGCTISANNAPDGGGITNFADLITLSGCTIFGNTAGTGGGISSYGGLTLNGCTLAGNSAARAGGGVFIYSASGAGGQVLNCTLTGNTADRDGPGFDGGGGLYVAGGPVTAHDSLIAGNFDTPGDAGPGTLHPDVAGLVISGGHNLVGDSTGSGGSFSGRGDLEGSAANPLQARLGVLQDNGGPTWTVAPLPGSPALGAGDPSGAPAADQRGEARLWRGTIDIGAFQHQDHLVTSAADGGPDSLRQAVANAGQGELVAFVPSFYGLTFTLTSGPLTPHNGAEVDGPEANRLALSGGGTDRVFVIPRGITAAISGLTLTGGRAGGDGGDVYNAGTLTLSGCAITGGSAADGGGLANFGALTLDSCTVSGNVARLGNGGGIYNSAVARQLVLSGCTISANNAVSDGGGLANDSAVTLNFCAVSGNRAGAAGGGLYNSASAPLAALSGCTISANNAPQGGGIFNNVTGGLTLNGCTVADNTAVYGGGLFGFGSLTLSGCTLAGNSAAQSGGGLYVYALAGVTDQILNTTVTGNTADSAGSGSGGGGIYIGLGALVVHDSLIAGNFDRPGFLVLSAISPDVVGVVSSGGHNLVGDGTGSSGFTGPGDLVGGAASPINAGLGALQDNGGPTWTVAPLPGSSALSAGDPSGAPAADQRGEARLWRGAIDIGAFQHQDHLVTSAADAGFGSLRRAVADAGQGELVAFVPSLYGQTFTLTSGPLTPHNGAEVDGPGANRLALSGGGSSQVFYIPAGVTAAVSGLTLTGGRSPGDGGDVSNAGTLTLSGCAITGGIAADGGGLANFGTLTLDACTVSGNGAPGLGGGLYNAGTATVIDSTFSGNTAGSPGAGIAAVGPQTTLIAVTIADNQAFGEGGSGGIWAGPGAGPVHLSDSLIAANTALVPGTPDVGGVFVSGGYNLVGVGAGAIGLADGSHGDRIGTVAAPLDPRLGLLQDNGGPTPTLALLPGSPALDAGDPTFNPPGGTDQRGLPRVVDGRADIGALEVQPTPTATTVQASVTDPVYGTLVTLTAGVHTADGAPAISAGTVTFEDGGAVLAAGIPLDGNGRASFTPRYLSGGAHLVTAVFDGSGPFTPSSGGLTETVIPALLTVTADDSFKVYGAANPGFTAHFAGFVPGQDFGNLAGTLSFSTPAAVSSHAGDYAIAPAGLSSSDYTITFVGGTLTVVPAPLTVTADNMTTVFGAVLPPLTASYQGLVNGDTSASLSAMPTLSTAAVAGAAVGAYDITPGGAASPDYQIRYVPGTLQILPLSSGNLQTALAGQGPMGLTLQPADTAQEAAALASINGLASQSVPVMVTLDLPAGSSADVVASPPAGVTLVIQGDGTLTTIVGHSPALTVTSGNVVVRDAVLTTATNAPTVLVTGGNLTLRGVTIRESTGFPQAALAITGGAVDLGTATDAGRNVLEVSGRGMLILNRGPNPIPALGDTFRVDGSTLANPYRIADRIFDALDAGSGGLVSYVTGNVYVSRAGGSIQRGVDAVATGGTVNVEGGDPDDFRNYVVGARPLTIRFEHGPTLTQVADLPGGQTSLRVTGAPGARDIEFELGRQAGSVAVEIGGFPTGTFSPTGQIVAHGGGANAHIEVSDRIALPALLFADGADAFLKGGGGATVEVGGGGRRTVLIGGRGPSVLIGGPGSARLEGRSAGDMLIAGTTVWDANEVALAALLREWAKTYDPADPVNDYRIRVQHLTGTSGGLNGGFFLDAHTVTRHSGAEDTLTGTGGLDLYFARLAGAEQDDLERLQKGEVVIEA